jgi:hypothetical protein
MESIKNEEENALMEFSHLTGQYKSPKFARMESCNFMDGVDETAAVDLLLLSDIDEDKEENHKVDEIKIQMATN